ncbi:MAG: hypothetical protein A3F68_01490 [Acidobacteria bacterium RIFCSPLOWO2_12_FULL_54_10]|nr:MAG: hypothetical protein A3F68_01490 [Acidobacteria bacterium RIFCSPLOWO2_12_FULL_54_10]
MRKKHVSFPLLGGIFSVLPCLVILTLLLGIPFAKAQVVLVEPGHALNQIVDSAVPLNPTQALLETTLPVGEIESVGIHPVTGDIYIQLQDPPGAFTSTTTHIFKVTPLGVVTPVKINIGFGINSRGTDLHFDPLSGLLITQDQNFGGSAGQVATVAPGTGIVGFWTLLPPPFASAGNTFGMDISKGTGGSDVPFGEALFTADVAATGMHSAPPGGPVTTHTPTPVGPGDDLVIQPDGDWVHVGDFNTPLEAYNPAVPEPHATALSPLDIQTMFTNAGLPFVFGSRGHCL